MQAKFVVLAVALCLFSAMAAADSITGVSPSTVPFGSSEEFITITGDHLIGTETTFVAYDSGETVEAGATRTSDGVDYVIVAIPPGVAFAAGPHTFDVIATDLDSTVRRIGPGTVNVGIGGGEPGPPQLTVPELVVAEAANSEGAFVTFDVSATAFDGSSVPVDCTPASGSQFSLGTTHVTCTASDQYGSATGRFDVFVTDTTPPVLILPNDIVSEVAEVNYTASATDALDGDVPVSCSPGSGSAFPAGDTQVLCSAHDAHFNYAFGTFLVTVTNGPPQLTVPVDDHVEATQPEGALVNYTVTATGTATVSCSPATNTVFPFGPTTVNCSASNSFGTVSASFTLTVIDTFAPVLTLPSPIVADATSPSGAIVNFTATANDLVSGPAAVTCDPPSGSAFPIGVTPVRCTAEDARGNPGYGTFMVTVNDFDHTPPVINVANVTAEATSAAGAVVNYTASAIDDRDGVVPVSCTPASGSQFPMGPTLVQCTASDSHGNTASASFYVNVMDTTAPTISSATANPSTLWPPNHKMVNVTVTVNATDAVGPITKKIVSVTSNQPVNGTGDGDTDIDWIINPNSLTLQLRAERSQGQTRIYTITVEAKDGAGNRSTRTVQVQVTH